jgi:V8-like Glu-specific endopeptidase
LIKATEEGLTVRREVDFYTLDLAILKIEGLDNDKLPSLIPEMNFDSTRDTSITFAGFPHYRWGNDPIIMGAQIVGKQIVSTFERFMLDRAVIYGSSGGPVLNSDNKVVGVLVSGEKNPERAEKTPYNSFIPITNIRLLLEG